MSRNYLSEFDTAPDEQKQFLVNRWIKQEPLPFFKQLREQRPVLVTPECVLIAKYHDVNDVLQMPDIFTTGLYLKNIYTSARNSGHFFAHDNDELHTREKAIMQSVLNRDDLPAIRSLVKENAKTILRQSRGNIELVSQYSRKIPIIVAQEYFGLQGTNTEQLKRWAVLSQLHTFFNYSFNLYSSKESQSIEEQYTRCSKEMMVYFKKLLLKKWLLIHTRDRILGSVFNAKDDIVKRLLRLSGIKPLNFSMMRVGTNLAGLLAGSVENTSSAVINMIKFLLARPELFDQLRQVAQSNDDNLFEKYIWELLRFVPITPYLFRQASQDFFVAKGTDWETKVSQGTTVLVLTQSAMFDEQVYKQADDFNPQHHHCHHLAYGAGSHECVGKYLAMAMIAEMLRELLLCEQLTIEGDIDYQNSPFPESCFISWRST